MMYGLSGFANLADTTSQRGGGGGCLGRQKSTCSVFDEESNGTTLEAQFEIFSKVAFSQPEAL